MPGHYMHHIVLRLRLPHRSAIRQWVSDRYGSEYDVAFLYCVSTPAQDANDYQVWLIPEPMASVGGRAYSYYGRLPQALANLYGNDVGELPADLEFPEDYIPYTDIFARAYVFKNFDDKLDYYVQLFKDFDTPKYLLFTIDAESVDDWYKGAKIYVGERSMDEWVRPLRPPTCLSRMEDYFRVAVQWAQF